MSQGLLFPFWAKKERFSAAGIQLVNWEGLGMAMAQSSSKQRQWITKRAARECGANHVLYKRKAKMTDECPLCKATETVLHVLQCPDLRAQQSWEAAQLCEGLSQWRRHGWVIPTTNAEDLIIQKNLIGWNGVLEGGFSAAWATAQTSFFELNDSRRTGFKWQVAVCRRIWQFPWSMWRHRNNVEHANDIQKETEVIDAAIREEIDRGEDNHEELTAALEVGRILEQ
jgi:hypothetical protein